MFRALCVCIAISLFWTCGGNSTPSEDAGRLDAGEISADAGAADAGHHEDAGMPDSGMSRDAGVTDGGALDSGMPDAGTPDSGTPDAGMVDAGLADAGTIDAGAPDSGEGDAGESDGGQILDSGVEDGGVDAGPECDTLKPCSGLLTCCANRCVNIDNEPAHCGQCDAPCTSEQFCGQGQCRNNELSQLCHMPVSTAVLDGFVEDDDAGVAVAQAIVSSCAPVMSLQFGVQGPPTLSDAGEPLALGEILVMGGGSFAQRGVRWLEDNNFAFIRDTSTPADAIFSLRDGGIVSSVPASTLGPSLDRALIQLVRTPRGAVVLNAAGFHAVGTLAAAHYFVETILPMHASLSTAWYVIEWEDLNSNDTPDSADRFTLIASGP